MIKAIKEMIGRLAGGREADVLMETRTNKSDTPEYFIDDHGSRRTPEEVISTVEFTRQFCGEETAADMLLSYAGSYYGNDRLLLENYRLYRSRLFEHISGPKESA